jgi:hypothetical protein
MQVKNKPTEKNFYNGYREAEGFADYKKNDSNYLSRRTSKNHHYQ